MRDNAITRAIVLALLLLAGTVGPTALHLDAAWAQDDDDDGGGGGGGGDDDDAPRATPGRDGGRSATPGRTRPAPPVPAAVPLPAFAPGEIVTLALSDADLALLLARGYAVIEARAVPQVGIVARRLAIPPGTTLEAARNEVRALASGADADFNHYYRSEQAAGGSACDGPHCPAFALIGWEPGVSTPGACGARVRIGVIDTGINPDHEAFTRARLDLHRIAPEATDLSRAVHGTAVVSILVGSPDSRSPGLLPEAEVIAVDAFHRRGGDERADVFALAAAIDYLAARDIRVVNMSLAGPPNTVLERAAAALTAREVLVVAAAGNGGPQAEPAYPAANPDVLAVTAVDATGQVYRRAGRGPHVDLAAPGVEVWTAASVRGARPKTGTSFAAPFVTAVAASILAAEPGLDRAGLVSRLTGGARDLGEAGFDEVYGHGLVQAPAPCAPTD